MIIHGRVMDLFSDDKKVGARSNSSSDEDEPLIPNNNKIISYGAQERCPSGVRM
jgi:hypothetical protein